MEIKLQYNHPKINKTEQELEYIESNEIKPRSSFALFRPGNKGAMAVVGNEADKEAARRLDEIWLELENLIGLTTVKALIFEIHAYIEIQKRRAKEHLITEPMALHMIFKGNPGTGKTTVARIVGRWFKEIGVLQKGHIIEVERADLVGEYIGHTAQKAREQVKKAIGGILFIDEAYSLARGGEKDFGKEAIDALVKAMEDNRENLILILAGYREEMNWFLQTNPGLRSRFPIHIDFPDYSNDQLINIAEVMLQKRQYKLSIEAKLALRSHLIDQSKYRHEYSGNARQIRNIIEKAIRRQAVRLIHQKAISRDELILISAADLEDSLNSESY